MNMAPIIRLVMSVHLLGVAVGVAGVSYDLKDTTDLGEKALTLIQECEKNIQRNKSCKLEAVINE